MESNLLLEQYSWYKKQQLAKAPFECLLNADIEPNPHQVNAFCAAIQALKTGGIILADEVGLGKTIEAGLVLNYVLDNGAKKVLISLPATLRKQWEVELLEKFGRQAVILDRYTVEHDRIKGLVWEGDGFLLLYKKLELGAFNWPRTKEEALEITPEQYQYLMQGLEIVARHPIQEVRPDKIL